MSIVDLLHRNSDNNSLCEKCKLSPDSLIYISPKPPANALSPISCDISVGTECYRPNTGKKYSLTEDGIKVQSGESVVIYAYEHIRTPFNVFGLVTGKGKYIYQGCMVASGKIDPGFDGRLRICFYNGGKRAIVLKPKEAFCTVFFVNTDYTLSAPLYSGQEKPLPIDNAMGWKRATAKYIKANWIALLALLIGLPTALHWLLDLIQKSPLKGLIHIID